MESVELILTAQITEHASTTSALIHALSMIHVAKMHNAKLLLTVQSAVVPMVGLVILTQNVINVGILQNKN